MSFKGKFKRLSALLLALIMIFTIVGCSQEQGEEVDTGEEVEDTEQVEDLDAEEEWEEIVVEDHLGREVKFEQPAERIVSGYYISTSIMLALGLKDRVVGIEAKPEKRPIYELAAPEFFDLATVGSMKDFDLEGTAALDPDLVVVSVRLKDSVENLENLGINVIAIDPESIEELEEAIEMVAKATGKEERARALKDYYEEKTAELDKITEGKERQDVYLGGNSDFLSTATSKMYQDTLISNAGGNNVAADIDDTYWATISYEQLIAYNPDVIVGAAGADYTVEDIINDDRLESVKAVENEEVYIMPNNFELWDSPIPSAILGNMWLASILNEEDYPFEKFKDEAHDFYSEFYGIDIDKDEIEK